MHEEGGAGSGRTLPGLYLPPPLRRSLRWRERVCASMQTHANASVPATVTPASSAVGGASLTVLGSCGGSTGGSGGRSCDAAADECGGDEGGEEGDIWSGGGGIESGTGTGGVHGGGGCIGAGDRGHGGGDCGGGGDRGGGGPLGGIGGDDGGAGGGGSEGGAGASTTVRTEWSP